MAQEWQNSAVLSSSYGLSWNVKLVPEEDSILAYKLLFQTNYWKLVPNLAPNMAPKVTRLAKIFVWLTDRQTSQ